MIRAINKAHDADRLHTILAENPFGPEHKAMLDKTNAASLISRILKEIGEVRVAVAAQGPLTEQLEAQAALLYKYDADFHEVLDRAIGRGEIPSGAGARAHYGRDLTSTTIPPLKTYDQLEEAAELIVTGEAKRLTAEGVGAVPMSMPTANRVGAVRDEFHDLRLLSAQAQFNTNKEREDLKALWDEALAGVEELWGAIEYHNRHDKDMASFRAKCEAFGVAYDYGDTTPDPDEPPTPPTPPAPPAPTPPTV